jgi:hypothetical protein
LLRNATRIGFLAVLLLATTSARATTYVGIGAGPAIGIGTSIVTFHTNGRDTLTSLGTGWDAEAQFGWESNPWVDFEGALRYALFDLDYLPPSSENPSGDRITSYSVVGFEGGIRVHLERIFTNTTPYIRGGMASYSPTVELNSTRTIGNDTAMGYYVGLGYVHEISGSFGIDVRATMTRFTAFGEQEWLVDLKSSVLVIGVSLVIF